MRDYWALNLLSIMSLDSPLHQEDFGNVYSQPKNRGVDGDMCLAVFSLSLPTPTHTYVESLSHFCALGDQEEKMAWIRSSKSSDRERLIPESSHFNEDILYRMIS